MGRILQGIYVSSRIFASRKLNFCPPSHSSFAAEITTPYPTFYNSIITSTSELLTDFINVLASPYSEKEYNKIDENWISYHVIC
jgi:hypothetical protein